MKSMRWGKVRILKRTMNSSFNIQRKKSQERKLKSTSACAIPLQKETVMSQIWFGFIEPKLKPKYQ